MTRRVGVTQRCLPANEFGEIRDALDSRWPIFLAACDIIPVPLPNHPVIALQIADSLDLDGILLTGGDDLSICGGELNARDETEYALHDWAIATGRPLVGVCRGLQLIVVRHGGNLSQMDGHVATRHFVNGSFQRMVNSYHRWSVVELPPPLVELGMSGPSVEAIEHRTARVHGIMWHPEREGSFAADDIRMFKQWFGAQ